MNLIDKTYFDPYKNAVGEQVKELVLHKNWKKEAIDLGYANIISAVFSSQIEGNSVDLNSFMNWKQFKSKTKATKDIREIEDLIKAYEFAQNNDLNEKSGLKAHGILSKSLLIKAKQGKYREEKIGVFGQEGLIYLAIEPENVRLAMRDFFEEIDILLKTNMDETEVFYFASMIHLRFVHIHPFADGNGRFARLLEKWFICCKLGEAFWFYPSESNYKKYQSNYYEHINLGVNFYELNYSKCLPFLLMLPNAVK